MPEEPLPQLAAGPVRQPRRPAGVPGEVRSSSRSRRPDRRPPGDQPLRLLRRGVRRALPVPLRATRRSTWSPTCAASTSPEASSGPGPLVQRLVGQLGDLAGRPIVDLLWQVNTAVHDATSATPSASSRACRPPTRRCGSASARAATRPGCWSACCAQLRSRGPLRLRLPRPARRRPGEPRRPERPHRRLHRPARLDRGVRARRRLDRARPDLGAVRRRGPHPALRDAAPHQRRRDHRAAIDPCESTLDFANVVTRFHEDPRVTLPYTADQWRRVHARRRGRSTSGSRRPTLELTMGGEPTFVSIDDMESAAVEHRRRRTRTSVSSPPTWPGGWARSSASARSSSAPRASGTQASRCRAGRSRWSGAPTACRCGSDPTLLADPWADAPGDAADRAGGAARGGTDRAARAAGRPADAGLRGPAGRRDRGRTPARGRPARGRADRRRRRAIGRGGRRPGRLGAAAAPRRRGRGQCLAEPAVALPPGPPGAASRRLPGRPAAAAGLGLLGRPAGRAGAVVPPRARAARPRPPARHGAAPGRGRRGSPHRPGGRGPRRVRPRLPAAAGPSGRLQRAAGPGGGRRRRRRRPRGHRGLRPAAGPPRRLADGDPRPGRHRGQPAADRVLGRAHPSSPSCSTTSRVRPGSAPRSSTSTACTPAPAAATT